MKLPIVALFKGVEEYGKKITQGPNFTSLSLIKNKILQVFNLEDNLFKFSMIKSKDLKAKSINRQDKIINARAANFIIRIFDNLIYEIKEGLVTLMFKILNTKIISGLTIPKDRRTNNKFLTMGIETINKNGILIP